MRRDSAVPGTDMANARKRKNNNTPLVVLMAGLLLVVVLIVAYGVIDKKNVNETVPAETKTSKTAEKQASDTEEQTGNTTTSENTVSESGTSESAMTVIATTDPGVITTLTTSAETTNAPKTTATETKRTTTTSSKKTTTTSEASKPTEPAITVDDQKYSSVPYYKSQYAERYAAYGKKNPKYTAEQIVTFVNIGLDKKYYTDTKTAINIGTRYILANKYFYMSKDYVPANMKKFGDKYIGSGNTGNMMVAEAVDAFEKMSDAAAEQGLSILARSGYRSYSFQEAIYNNMVKIYSQEKADTFSARPGYSEHQTGYAVDVCTKTVPYDQFETTKEYQWAKENIHKYGFVIHYTKANEWITGYMDEAWHFRYIGVKEATEIYNSGLSVDEYIIRYHND